MGKVRSARNLFLRKGSYYLVAKILVSTVFLVHAGLVQSVITTPTPQSITGGALNIVSTLASADKGFSKAGSGMSEAGRNCGQKVVFSGSPGTANNVVVAGDIIYVVQLNTTSSTPVNACFTVTLTITPTGGSPTSYSVRIGTGSPVTAGQTIDCKFDIGTSFPSSPFSFKLTV